MMQAICSRHDFVPSEELLDGHCPLCLFGLGLNEEPAGEVSDVTAIHPRMLDSSPDRGLTPGMIVAGRFRITSLLGRGGMGEVYRAEDLKLGQPVALKFLSPRRIATPGAERFIYDEVRIGRQIAHPNVCRIYDVFEISGQPFIAMEFVDGEDLSTLIGRIRRLPYEKALDIARELCAGLEAAHEKGIIHGDLKPANIMIDGRGRARITDFGLSRLAADAPDRTTLAGTLAYMAPEQLLRNEVSRQTDIYTLGLVLYEIFTGRRARTAVTVEELKASLDAVPSPPSDYGLIEPATEESIMSCLAVDPARRPSARQLIDALPRVDPIAAMIAAGDTPPPDVIAASGMVVPLRLGPAAALLIAFLTMLAGVVSLSGHLTLYGRATLIKHPAALAERAQTIAERLAWSGPAADTAFWFEPRPGSDDSIDFHWRASPAPMLSLGSEGRIRSDIPDVNVPGMAHVVLDSSGTLRKLKVVPRETAARSTPTDWNLVLAAANLAAPSLSPRTPAWSPAVAHDERREWVIGDQVVRASAFAGRLTAFEIGSTPSADVGRAFGASRLPHVVYLILLAVTLTAGTWLARRNMRAGRVDSRGARRVALWVFICRLLYGLLVGHHPLTIEKEASFLAALLGASLLLATEVWLGYVALEPLVRKIAPRAMITWTRVSQGRLHDPAVGRDVLSGALAGVALRLLDHLRNYLAMVVPELESLPSQLAVESLGSMRVLFAVLFHSQARAIFYALFALFLLVLLRAALRNRHAASAVWLVATTLAWSRWEDVRVDVPIVALQMMIVLIVLQKMGLFPAAVAIFSHLLMVYVPLTFDWSAFYFSHSLVALLVLSSLAICGFHAAVGGGPALRRALSRSNPLL